MDDILSVSNVGHQVAFIIDTPHAIHACLSLSANDRH